MIFFGDFGARRSVDALDYYRMALLADATGQANGTGYTTEESRNAFAMTYNGNAAISSGKFEFDGVGDYIQIAHSILWTFGSKFTIEIFGLELDAVNTGTPQIIASQYSADAGLLGWLISEDGSGNFVFRYSVNGSTTVAVTIGSAAASTVYDLAVCWDGATIYSFINGEPAGSGSFSGEFFDSSQPLRFGCDFETGVAQRFLNGRFTCISLTRGVTYYQQGAQHSVPSLPRSVNTPSLTDSNWPNVIVLVRYDDVMGRIRDVGPYDMPLSKNGNVAGSTSIEPFADANSIAFDGSGDFLQLADDPLLEVGSGALTIELFARHNVNTTLQTYVSKWNTTSGDRRSYNLAYRGADATDVVRMDIDADGASGGVVNVTSAAYTPVVDQFDHVAYCRSGNDHRIFIDGTQSGSTVTNAVSAFNGIAVFNIGTQDGGGFMNGYLSEIRMTKAARYTSSFTPPSALLPTG